MSDYDVHRCTELRLVILYLCLYYPWLKSGQSVFEEVRERRNRSNYVVRTTGTLGTRLLLSRYLILFGFWNELSGVLSLNRWLILVVKTFNVTDLKTERTQCSCLSQSQKLASTIIKLVTDFILGSNTWFFLLKRNLTKVC